MRGKRFLVLTPLVVLFAAGVLVRSASNLNPEIACGTADYSGLPTLERLANFEGEKVFAPVLATKEQDGQVLGVASPNERWIEIDLSEQKLRAWDGDSLFLESLVSTGLPYYPTPTGEFRIWVKLRATKMEGGSGRYYYYLPNVPYVMFFENDQIPGWKGYGLHGTYWHNDFGTQRSHGCVNLPTSIAEKIYYWAGPALPEGKASVFADNENKGIRIVIHE